MNIPQAKRLIRQAAAARRRAYAPYSKFRVGAALLTAGGRVVPGCNVENASYGLTLCAERTALATAVAGGHHDIRAVAVVAGGRQPVRPCGACLQVLAEFCRPDTPIVLAAAGRPAAFRVFRLRDLLPHAFRMSRA